MRAGRVLAGRVLAGSPALPEGKAGRAGRRVPGGDRRRCPAGRWPMGRAGLPPGTAGIHPRLRPARQVGPARDGGGPGTRPGAARRYVPVPAPPGGDGPGDGPAADRVPRGGHGGACRRRASACRRAAR